MSVQLFRLNDRIAGRLRGQRVLRGRHRRSDVLHTKTTESRSRAAHDPSHQTALRAATYPAQAHRRQEPRGQCGQWRSGAKKESKPDRPKKSPR